jgi:zinc/manganese transport system permease protein
MAVGGRPTYIATVMLLASLAVAVTSIERVELLAVAVLSSLMMGVVSPLIAARRLYFLAVESSHMALLAASLAVVLVNTTPVKYEFFWVLLVGLAIMYSIGLAIHRGVDPDIATSIATGATVSGSVIAMYVALTRFRTSYSLWSLILGDPLLVTRQDIYVLAVLATVTVVASLAIYKVMIYVGIDRDSAVLAFSSIRVCEFLFFTVLGLTSLALVKIVGYALEHVLLLMPALMSMNLVEGGRKVMALSICLSAASSLLGFSAAVKLSIAPAGSVGLVALAIYLASIVARGLRRHG